MKFNQIAAFMLSIAFVTLGLIIIVTYQKHNEIIGLDYNNSGAVPMPIVKDSKPEQTRKQWFAPEEQRGPEVYKWLSMGCRIQASGSYGSGTICYYDRQSQEAYVISCGHLWSGTRSAESLKDRPITVTLRFWHKNGQKLSQPQEFQAQVLFYSNNRGSDCSLLKFKPDWQPQYLPIAPKNYQELKKGQHLHSVGCDGAREIAHYDVLFVEYRDGDLIIEKNGPRSGRSGGGLHDEKYYVAICWGSSDPRNGSGIGFFTPLSSIHSNFSREGFDFVLKGKINNPAFDIPIQDQQNPNNQFKPNDLILSPQNNVFTIPRSVGLKQP